MKTKFSVNFHVGTMCCHRHSSRVTSYIVYVHVYGYVESKSFWPLNSGIRKWLKLLSSDGRYLVLHMKGLCVVRTPKEIFFIQIDFSMFLLCKKSEILLSFSVIRNRMNVTLINWWKVCSMCEEFPIHKRFYIYYIWMLWCCTYRHGKSKEQWPDYAMPMITQCVWKVEK